MEDLFLGMMILILNAQEKITISFSSFSKELGDKHNLLTRN